MVADHGLEWRLIRDDAGAFQGALSALGLPRRIGADRPARPGRPRIVARTDMAALIPRRLAVAYAERYRLRLFDPPYPSPPHAVGAVWDRGHGEQAPVAWLRQPAARSRARGRRRQPSEPVHRLSAGTVR